MNNELSTVQNPPTAVPAPVTDYSQLAIDYLANMGLANLPQSQQRQFVEMARAFNLNPFKREIYAVSYGSNFNIITGYEVYIKRAERTGLLNGWQCYIEGTEPYIKAVLVIDRKDWSHQFRHEVYMSEYNTGKSLWASKPLTMLKKVAMAQGFRLCFPDELGGMPYTSDETGMDNEVPTPPERNVTPAPTQLEAPQTAPAPQQSVAVQTVQQTMQNMGMMPASNIIPHCTQEQADKMKQLFASTYPDGTPVMDDSEKEMYRAMGKQTSMQDTITSCTKYIEVRQQEWMRTHQQAQNAPAPQQPDFDIF